MTEGMNPIKVGKSIFHDPSSLDPESFKESRQIEDYDHDDPVSRLNEFQYIQNENNANVLQTDRIACIALDTGRGIEWIELKALLSPKHIGEPVSIFKGLQIGFKTPWEHGRKPADFLKGPWIGLKAFLGSDGNIAPVNGLNDIGYDAKNARLFVTGKFCPKLFEI